MEPITVLVADGMKLFSQSLGMAFWWFPDLAVLGEHPETGPQAVDAVTKLHPDVALIDYAIPEMEGSAVAALIKVRSPDTKVILMSWVPGPLEIQNSLSAGAVGFLPKNIRVEQVVEAIRRAHGGEAPVGAEQLKKLSKAIRGKADQLAEVRKRLMELTPKEIEVLRLLSYGKTIPEIAKELSISPGTVRLHFHNLVKKAGAKTKEQVLAMARSCGLIRT